MAACRSGGARAAPTEAGEPPAPSPGRFVADFRADRVRGIGDMKRIVRQGGRRRADPRRPRQGPLRRLGAGAAARPALRPHAGRGQPALYRAAEPGRHHAATRRRCGRASRRRAWRPSARSSPPAAAASPPASWRSAWCAPACRRRRCTTAPGPNGPRGPKPRRRRQPDAGRRPSEKPKPAPRLRHPPEPCRARRHAGAWLRQPGGASRLHRAVPGLRGAARRGASAASTQFLTYGTQGGPTHYALEDMIAEIEGGTRCADRRHRPRRGRGAAAGLPEGRRPLPDAGQRLRPRAQPLRRPAEGLGRRDHLLRPDGGRGGDARADPPEHPRRLHRKPRQPHLRGAGHPGHRPRRACRAAPRC